MSEPQKYTSPRTKKVGAPTLTVYCEDVVIHPDASHRALQGLAQPDVVV